MVRLEKSETFGRKIRKDDWNEIGVPTWIKIKEAIEGGRSKEALELVDYSSIEGKGLHDGYGDWIYHLLTLIADNWGEDEMYKTMRQTGDLSWKAWIAKIPSLPLEEVIQFCAENMRAHRSGPGEMGNFTVIEESDRYIMSFDPCGSGGRMRRTGEIDKTPPRTGPPYNFGKTKKAYPWSWGKVGVPYYCVHCCVWGEIMPVELNGYPYRVCEYSDDPEVPCSWVFYKKPELIPERYFTRIGKDKKV